jgi:hypothetical protein
MNDEDNEASCILSLTSTELDESAIKRSIALCSRKDGVLIHMSVDSDKVSVIASIAATEKGTTTRHLLWFVKTRMLVFFGSMVAFIVLHVDGGRFVVYHHSVFWGIIRKFGLTIIERGDVITDSRPNSNEEIEQGLN